MKIIRFIFVLAMLCSCSKQASEVVEVDPGVNVNEVDLVLDAFTVLRAPQEHVRVIAQVSLVDRDVRNLGKINATSESVATLSQFAETLGVMESHRIGATDMVVFEVTLDQYIELKRAGIAKQIYEDVADEPNLFSALPVIEANHMHTNGARGLGRTVVVLDNGFQADHSFFNGKVVEEACFSSNSSVSTSLCPNRATSATTAGASSVCGSAAVNPCRHGTHVAGIVASSNSTNTGVAPAANLVTIQVFSDFDRTYSGCNSRLCSLTYNSDQLSALDYVLNTLRFRHPIAAVNISTGGGSNTTCNGDIRAQVVQNLRNVGIATVIASGNNGFIDAVNAPGCIEAAITVGNTRDNDTINPSSNSGDIVDLLAPGTGITSSVPSNTTARLTGTSMSAPMVAGAIGALQSHFAMSVDQVEQILESTGVDVATLNTNRLRPRIDLQAAYDRVNALVPTNDFVWMRDTWNDTGREPDPITAGQSMSRSPDIWIRNQQDGTGTNMHKHQNPEFGQANWAYVLLKNSGKASAQGELKLYFATANISSVPNWTFIGSQTFNAANPLPTQNDTIVEIPWTTVPAPSHFCLFAYWRATGEPADPTVNAGISQAVRNSNDLVWRNVNSVDSVNNSSAVSFARNPDGSANLVIDIRKLTPEELGDLGRLLLKLNVKVPDLGKEPTSQYYSYEQTGEGMLIEIPLRPGVYYIPNLDIPKDAEATIQLKFALRDSDRKPKGQEALSVSVQNVPNIRMHKAGKDQECPEVLYILSH